MNNKFNSFYFLHIQKTGGRDFVFNVVESIKPTLLKNNIKFLDNDINETSHSQWRKDITNMTYVASIIRDPCKQAISFYVHSHTIDNFGNKNNNNFTLSVNDFFDWFYQNESVMKNYQSKNFILSTIENKESFSQDFAKNNLINKNDVFEKIKKVSLLLKSEVLKQENVDKIKNKIFNDFDIIDYSIDKIYWDNPENKNINSTMIYNLLTEQQKEQIRSISNIDTEIYETDDFFYKL